MPADFRVERDSMGELEGARVGAVGRADAARSQQFSDQRLANAAVVHPRAGAHQVGRCRTNRSFGLLPEAIAKAIEGGALEVANGMHADQFPIDVFQTGSGTSSNMNANEVIARLATQSLGSPVHPNDHVNMSQSSNDSIPSAIHVERGARAQQQAAAGARAPRSDDRSESARGRRRRQDGAHAFDGRDAGAARSRARRLGGAGASDIRLKAVLPRLTGLAQGGTAVGTGINAHPKFGAEFAAALAKQTGVDFHPPTISSRR